MATSGPPSRSRGYTLIEMLVVLAIVSVLIVVSIGGLTPKTPKAVRAATFDLKSLIQDARAYAIQNGREVTFKIAMDSSTKPASPRFTATVTFVNGAVSTTKTVIDTVMERTNFRYGTLITAKGSIPATTPDIETLQAFKTLMVTGGATSFGGWGNNLDTITTATFTTSGTVISKTSAGVRSTLGGCWIGVSGNNPNQKGVPVGLVFVNDDGKILAFYKPDSALNSPDEFLWQRME